MKSKTQPGMAIERHPTPTTSDRAVHYASSWIDIDADALRRNVAALRDFLGDTTLGIVVKGNAYGHGYAPVVPVFEDAGIDRFLVFGASEAAAFKQVARPDSRLQIMGYIPPEAVPWAVAEDCEPWIGSPAVWPQLKAEAERQDARVRVHLEVETGMNRLGCRADLAEEIAREVVDHPNVELEGLCTHLAGAEDHRNDGRIGQQVRIFHELADRLQDMGIRPRVRHMASSSAALLHPETRLDMVRIGIASYGFWPTQEVWHRHRNANGGSTALQLERALSWKSHIMHVHDVQDGEFVGYGASYQAEGPKKVAVVPVGYADGFSRGLSNAGYVLVRGRRAGIIGTVNMNMVQVHVTHVPDVQVGDEVVLIGHQADQEVTVSSFADYNNIVNYEFMTRLPVDIPRRLTGGD